MTCVKKSNPDNDYDNDIVVGVLGNLALNSGKSYWELKIDNVEEYDQMFIGVCRNDFDLSRSPGSSEQDWWGYHTTSGEKFTPEEKQVDYADVINPGDAIGVLLEFKKGFGTLKFYLNGMDMGECATNMRGEFYPMVSFLGATSSVTLDAKATCPLN